MRRLCVAGAVLFLSLAFAGPVLADAIGTGCDCFTTASPGSQVQIPNFAANYPGCTPANGIVQLQGCGPVDCHGCTNALIITNTDAHGTPVDPNSAHKVNTSSYCPPTVDTVVCRTNGASFTSPGENHPIGTQLVELSLCSNGCPITCGAATYKIKVTADGAQPTGSTTFTATSFSPSLSGTTSLTHFPVNYKVELIRCDQPGSLSPVTGSIDFVQHNGGFSKNVNGSMSSVWQQAVLGGLLITLTAWFLVARRRRVGGEEAS